MFFKTASRINPQTGRMSIYYRIVENYRNILGDTRQRTILSVGFMEGVTPAELWSIADGLNACYAGEPVLFGASALVEDYTDRLWERPASEKKPDIVREIQQREKRRDRQRIDTGSIRNKDVRELGAEWMSLPTLGRLGVDGFLKDRGFSEPGCHLALSHIVSRAVYPASELKTVSFMQENSSICEPTGLDTGKITKDSLYRISMKLYKEKDALEKYLSRKTNELFDLEDKIILYDLTYSE
jgi:hypothetical protein